MAEDARVDPAISSEPVFRAPKRRRIQRKRAENEDDEPAADTELQKESGDATTQDEGVGLGEVTKIERRPGARKGGIAFTSGASKSADIADSQETAIVLADTAQLQEQIQNDRFVKPTGRAGLVEDRHMVDYIDSKLAEQRSASAVKSPTPTEATLSSYGVLSSTSAFKPRPHLTEIEEVDIAKLRKRPSHHNSSNPTATQAHPPPSTSSRPPHRRRRPPLRTEQDLTRDALVDEILREAPQVAHYSQPLTSHPSANANGEENDEAVAEAFKAEFLEEMEARRRRKVESAGGGGAAGGGPGGEKVSQGPKLGGSRSQRVRMKALEAEQAAGQGRK